MSWDAIATGLHDAGDVADAPGPAGSFGRLLHWLGDGSLAFSALPDRFDTVRLLDTSQPGGEFRFSFATPEADNLTRLKALFSHDTKGLDAYAKALRQAGRMMMQRVATRPRCWCFAIGPVSPSGKRHTWGKGPKTTWPPRPGWKIGCWRSSAECSPRCAAASWFTSWPRRSYTPAARAHGGAPCTAFASRPSACSTPVCMCAPVPGLFLAGQAVASLGGFMAAAAVEPRLWKEMNR